MVAVVVSIAAAAPALRQARPTAPARPAERIAPRPALPAAEYDYGRIVRIWNVAAPAELAAETGRSADGSRIVFASNVPAPADLAALASAGFTLLQTDSDHQSTEEVRPNVWDYGAADRAQAVALGAGFNWCYFPHFSFPPRWYADRIPFTRVQCLEHGKGIEAYSPWDPNFGYFLNRGYEMLAKHYGRRPPVPALYLGVHGDYGECGFFIGARTAVAGQKEQWEQRFGDLHNHVGWWCGDPLARAAFASAMLNRYGSVEGLNRAWRTTYSTAAAVAYPASPSAASRRHWLDWVQWYRDSVSAMTDTVCRVARRHFPDALLVLPVGFADEDPRNGADNSMLVKVAARHRVHVRSTHGGFRPVAANQATMLGRLASACGQYGVPLWTEPPSTIAPEAQAARAFETVSLGARGHYDWSANVVTGRDAYYRSAKHMRVSRRITDVAMFFPTTSHLLRPDQGYPPTLQRGCASIRDVLDYDIVDERMILDGALDRYRVLAWWEGNVVEASVLGQIRAWVQRGGTLVAYDFGKIETVEGNTDWFREVLGHAGRLSAASGTLRFVLAPGARVPRTFRIPMGDRAAAQFLDGDWYEPETVASVARRWTGASAEIRVPSPGAGDLVMSVRASFPPEASGLRREVLVNGTQVGILDLAGEHTYRFSVPEAIVGGRSVLRIVLRCATFTPSATITGSGDTRPLGVWVEHVQLQSVGAPTSADAPVPQGRFEVGVDLRRLRSEWARPMGRGWTVFFPARRDQLPAFCEVVRYVTYHLSDLDPTKRDAIVVDNAWDGVYATLCTDRALYLNDGESPVFRTIVLSPSAFAATAAGDLAGRPTPVKPETYTHELTLEPHSIASIPFGRPPEEMLLQCERFTMLGAVEPLDGPTFSPATGKTHVLIPERGEIGTRFVCDVAGTYRVFYRATRRGAMSAAQVLVNGRPCKPLPDARVGPAGRTICAGTVALGRGVHALTLKPMPGEDVRGDFVILTTDTAIAGYGFAVK